MKQACNLSQQRCIPCEGGVPRLQGEQLQAYLAQLPADWRVVGEHHLEKTFHFPDFKTALQFTNAVGELVEEEGHHPDIYLAYGKVKIMLWTHKIDGLAESDFIFAAKCEKRKSG